MCLDARVQNLGLTHRLSFVQGSRVTATVPIEIVENQNSPALRCNSHVDTGKKSLAFNPAHSNEVQHIVTGQSSFDHAESLPLALSVSERYASAVT
eukprot:SAG31_NODE_3267_length_4478_cov_2.996118_4_plen_96_part_00